MEAVIDESHRPEPSSKTICPTFVIDESHRPEPSSKTLCPTFAPILFIISNH